LDRGCELNYQILARAGAASDSNRGWLMNFILAQDHAKHETWLGANSWMRLREAEDRACIRGLSSNASLANDQAVLESSCGFKSGFLLIAAEASAWLRVVCLNRNDASAHAVFDMLYKSNSLIRTMEEAAIDCSSGVWNNLLRAKDQGVLASSCGLKWDILLSAAAEIACIPGTSWIYRGDTAQAVFARSYGSASKPKDVLDKKCSSIQCKLFTGHSWPSFATRCSAAATLKASSSFMCKRVYFMTSSAEYMITISLLIRKEQSALITPLWLPCTLRWLGSDDKCCLAAYGCYLRTSRVPFGIGATPELQ